LLAGFAIRVVDRASLRHFGGLAELGAVFHLRGHAVQAAVVDGGFLRRGGTDGAQVVGGFQATQPRHLVGHVELLAVGLGDVQVQRLCLVDPLLATAGGLHQPARLDLERGAVDFLQVIRHAINRLHGPVVVFQVVDHDVVPQAARLQVVHQVRVDHGELAGQVRFHVQVLVGRLDRLRYAGDVGDGGGRGNGHDVGVAHAAGANLVAQAFPVERLAAIHLQVTLAAFARQYLDGIDRQDTLAPQRAFVGGVAATFLGQFAGRLDGEVADGFHGTVGKLDGLRRGIRDVLDVQRILEAHDAHAYRAVLEVGVTRLRYAVVVDVDHVIEHAHGGLDGLLQLDQVETTFA